MDYESEEVSTLHYYKGSTIVPIIITLLLVIVAAVVAAFFLWPVPEPKILISNVSPVPKNAERIQYTEKVILRWEAVYERPRHGLLAEVFAGKDKSTLKRLALDLQGELTSSTEGIFSFSHEFEVDPHSQYWWKVRLYTEGGKSAESEIWTFVLMNTYPQRPELLPPGSDLGNVPLKDLILNWNSSDPDGDKLVYDVFFGREPRLDEKDILIMGAEKSTVDVSSLKRLDYSTKYYWKVVARDPFGGESVSYTESFTTQMRADLPAVTPDNPRSGASDFDVSIGSLSWKTSLPLEYYLDELYFDVYLAEGQSRHSMIGTTNSTEIPVPSLKGHTTYSWYIVVRDSAGKEKKSEEWIFRTSNRAPIIEMEYPSVPPGQASVPVTWSVNDPDGDIVTSEVFFGQEGEEPMRIASGRMTSVFLSALDEGTRYRLLISASDTNEGRTEREIIISPGNEPPSVSAEHPVSLEQVEPSLVAFKWSGEDPDGDSIQYELHLQSRDDSRIIESIDSQEYFARELKANEDYRWFVLAIDSKGGFSRSEDATFSTGDKSLALTLPIAPKPGVEEVAISNAVFSWEIDGNSEGLSYRFTLATDDQMNNIVFEQVLTQTNLELTQDLLGNKEYFWRVDVIREDSEMQGEIWSFRSENLPPKVPELQFPVDGASEVSTRNLTLRWESSDSDGDIVSAKVYLREPDGIEREYIASGNSYTVENLEPGRRYEWAIEVTDDGGKSTLSSYYSFITGNQKPVIKLSQPSRMFLEGVITPLVIEWKLDDPEGEDLDVEVFMNTSEESLGSPVARGRNLQRYVIEDLVSGKDYLLTVAAEDPGGERNTLEIPIKTRVSGLIYEYPIEGFYEEDRDFSWSYLQENSGYVFRLYDSDFSPLVRKAIQNNTYKPELTLEDGKQYYWAVSVLRDNDEYAGEVVAFISGRPYIVELDSPENDAIVPASGTVLRWSLEGDIGTIRQKELYFGEPGSLSRHTPVGDSFETGRLLSGRKYEWYVQLTDDNGVTTRSDTYGFVVDNSPPEISLISPVDGGTVIQSYVDLVWSSYDPDGDQLTYSVYFGTGPELELYRESMQTNQIRISGLLIDETYRWYIVASDEKNSVTSQMRTFYAISRQVNLETVSPVSGSTSDISPVFTWRADGMNGGEYRVFLGESQSQMSLLGTTTNNSLRYQGQLENDKAYYWRVELWRDGRLLSSTTASQFITRSSEVTTSVEDRDVAVLYFGGAFNIVSLSSAGLEIVEIPYQYDGGVPPIMNGNVLYVIDETGRLSAIDTSFGRAEVVGTLLTDTTPEKMVFEGGYLWILDTKSAGAVIRVSLNRSGIPESIDSVYRDWTTPVDLFVTKDLSRIYLADALSGIKILEKDGARYVDRTSSFSVSLEGYSRAVAEKDGVVFSGEAGMDGGLKLIDAEESFKSNVGRYYIVLRIEVSGSLLYASTDKGVAIVDIRDPSSPVVLRDLELTQVDEISVSGKLLVVKSGSSMLIYDLERPNDPVLLESRNE